MKLRSKAAAVTLCLCLFFFAVPVSAEEVAQESVGDGRIEGGGYCEIHTCHTFESVLK